MYKVFIDGREGTTGLRIEERLRAFSDIELIVLPDALRKDERSRSRALNACDIAFLCLPDKASVEAVSMIENEAVRVIDASTAHRTNPDWVYGLPELSAFQKNAVKGARRVAVPGCHASGYIALVAPLVEAGILPKDAYLTVHSLTGYSGGGKKMIAQYEDEDRDACLDAPRAYALSQTHKHLNEMRIMTNTNISPIFCPIVSDFYSGMLVALPLFQAQLAVGAKACDVRECLEAKYRGEIVRYAAQTDEAGFLSAGARAGLDSMEISVFGNEDRLLLAARYDNLGKGASGAALQCMNLMLGFPETRGLSI